MPETYQTTTAGIIQRDTLKRLGPRLRGLPEFSLPADCEDVFGDLLKKLDAAARENQAPSH
jgi:hypothetical protein